MEQRLNSVAALRTEQFTATPRVLSKGLRKNVPEAGLELTLGQCTAWLNAHETLRLLEGTISVLDSWPGSPEQLFISLPASAPADSAAGIAMAQTPADQLGILHPDVVGELQLLTALDTATQHRLASWLRTFSHG